MKKSLFTTIAIATILTAGAVKADEINLQPQEPQQALATYDYHVSNISATMDGKNISSGVIDINYDTTYELQFKVTGWGGELPKGGILVVETMSGAYIGDIQEDGTAVVNIMLTNRLADTQLLQVRTQGFTTDAPMTITANVSEKEVVPDPEPVPPVDPVEPEQPTEPTEPEQPVEPSEPEQPVTPEQPTEPSEPETPEQPVEVLPPHIEEPVVNETTPNIQEPVVNETTPHIEEPKTVVEDNKQPLETIQEEQVIETPAEEVEDTLPETGDSLLSNLLTALGMALFAVVVALVIVKVKHSKED